MSTETIRLMRDVEKGGGVREGDGGGGGEREGDYTPIATLSPPE